MSRTSSTPACSSRAPVTSPANPPPMTATVTSSCSGARARRRSVYGSSRKWANRPGGLEVLVVAVGTQALVALGAVLGSQRLVVDHRVRHVPPSGSDGSHRPPSRRARSPTNPRLFVGAPRRSFRAIGRVIRSPGTSPDGKQRRDLRYEHVYDGDVEAEAETLLDRDLLDRHPGNGDVAGQRNVSSEVGALGRRVERCDGAIGRGRRACDRRRNHQRVRDDEPGTVAGVAVGDVSRARRTDREAGEEAERAPGDLRCVRARQIVSPTR